MNKELSVLSNIDYLENTTQRDIARMTGMSLGNVNAAIKNLVIKGYLKKTPTGEKDLHYVLTDEGKRKCSINLLDKYVEIISLTLNIKRQTEDVITEYCINKGLTPVLSGENDEVKNYLVSIFKKLNINYEERKIAEDNNINYNREDNINIVWHPDTEAEMLKAGGRYINILDKIERKIRI